MTTLYRGVMPEELADIQQTGQLINRGSAEGKYFSLDPGGVSSYAKQAVKGFGDPPYTMVQTQIPTRLLTGYCEESQAAAEGICVRGCP